MGWGGRGSGVPMWHDAKWGLDVLRGRSAPSSASRRSRTCRAAAHGALTTRPRAWWGGRFWRARPRTTGTFRSMHDELHHMHCFERLLRAAGAAPWTEREYRAWWDVERRQVLRGRGRGCGVGGGVPSACALNPRA